jgi:NAD(P)-dependent dehydrogenase (short-subunit alcohol dehydrogenase family)
MFLGGSRGYVLVRALCHALNKDRPSERERARARPPSALGPSHNRSMPTTLITGATAGLGLAAAHQLVNAGHTVLIHGRTDSKVKDVVEKLNAKKAGSASGYIADLSLMSDVRKLGADIARDHPSLDGLLNNAGSFDGDYTGKRVETAEGNEYTLAVNTLAPFLLTSLLLPCLRASGHGRVVISSSVSMGAANRLDDLQLSSSYSEHTAYSLSKLCDAMIIHELHARYGDAPKLTFNTMDPTEQIGMGADTKMLRAGWGNWGTKPEKATISADMMHSKDWANRSGQGFARRREIADPASRKKLWDECVRLTGAMYD